MTSRSPSPASIDFADSCFLSENDSKKRRRDSDRSSSPAGRPPNKLVAETLLPDESQLVQDFQPPISKTAASRAVGIVQETHTIVPCSQSQQPRSPAAANERDAASDDDSVEEAQEALDPQSAIPSDWTAGNPNHGDTMSSHVLSAPNGDGTFTIKFDWSTATAETSLNFLTSKILGTVKKRGMGCYLRHALKTLSKVKPATPYSLFFEGILKAGQKALGNAAQKGTELKSHFKTGFESNKELFVRAMNTYVLGQPVKLYACKHPSDDGRLIPLNHLPQHSDLNALARVIVLMSDPTVLHACILSLMTTSSCHCTAGTDHVAEHCQRGQDKARC